MAAVEHRRVRNGGRYTQGRVTAKPLDVTSVCDAVEPCKRGLRRSARLKEKLAAHRGSADEITRLGKRNWEGRRSQRSPVGGVPGAKKAYGFQATVNLGRRRSMDDHDVIGESRSSARRGSSQTVSNKLKLLSSAGSPPHEKEREEESDYVAANLSVQHSPDGPPQRKQKVVKSPFFSKKHCQMTKLAYKVKRHRHLLYPYFKPALSPIGLVQEKLYDNPWKLLVATIFLNRTTGTLALPVLWKFFELFPDPNAVLTGNPLDIANLMQPLGLNNKRASIILRLSKEYLTKDWVYPEELHGIGKYGNDSYRIFCCGAEWLEVTPTDHKLNEYYEWLTKQHADGVLVMDSSWYPTVGEETN